MQKIAIIGAGAWGTALSIALAGKSREISLWVYEPELCNSLSETRVNTLYLPGFFIPENVIPTNRVETAVRDAEAIFLVVPSPHMRGICRQISSFLQPEQVLLSAAKGLEIGTLSRMTEVVACTLR